MKTIRRRGTVLMLFLCAGCVCGCEKIERDWTRCNEANRECLGGDFCDFGEHRCVPRMDAQAPAGGEDGGQSVDAAVRADGAEAARPDVQGVVDSPLKADLLVAVAPDLAPPECLEDGDCTDEARAFCVAGTCVGCARAGAGACIGKSAATPACSPSGSCVGCLDDSACPDGVCDIPTNSCVGCLRNVDCSGETPLCEGRVCVACKTADECRAKSQTTRACAPSGACVECTSELECGGALPVCDPAMNKCVQCLDHNDCKGSTPICNQNACVACKSAEDCKAKDVAAPLCLPGGACVQCTDKSACPTKAPLCNPSTNTCVQCLSHADCTGATTVCVPATMTCQ